MPIEDKSPSRVLPPEGDDATKAKIDELLKAFREYEKSPPPVVKEMGASNLVTNVSLAALLAPMAADIKEIKGEVVNPLLVELLQQARLDTLAAAIKKSPLYENNPEWWKYGLLAAGGIIVSVVAAGLLLRLGAWVTSKLPTFFTGGAGSPNLSPDEVERLRDALTDTNPLLRTYADQVRRLPRAKELLARADAIRRLKLAVDAQNNTEVLAAAEAIKSLKTALRNFDPKKLPTNHSALRKTADALDRLRGAIDRLKIDDVRQAQQAFLRLKIVLRNLKPTDIPKSGDMRSAARAARGLTSATRRLTGALAPLGPALRGVSTAAGATATSLGS